MNEPRRDPCDEDPDLIAVSETTYVAIEIADEGGDERALIEALVCERGADEALRLLALLVMRQMRGILARLYGTRMHRTAQDFAFAMVTANIDWRMCSRSFEMDRAYSEMCDAAAEYEDGAVVHELAQFCGTFVRLRAAGSGISPLECWQAIAYPFAARDDLGS